MFVISYGEVDKSVYADPPLSAQSCNLANFSLKDNGEPEWDEDDKSTYENRKKFHIQDKQGLRVFAALINWNKVNFSGKTVKMYADVDYGGGALGIGWYYGGVIGIGAENRWFQGDEFDGNNYTIHNFKLNSGYFYGGTADAYGFFSRIDSQTTIKNLKLKDYSLTVAEASSSYGQSTGGMVGYLNGGTIQNCIVENFSVSATYSASSSNQMCVGGIFGVGYGTVSNCLVKDVSASNTKRTAGIGPADYPYTKKSNSAGHGPSAHYIVTYYPNDKSTISSCVMQNFNCSEGIAMESYASNNSGTVVFTNYNHSISNCQNTEGSPSVSSWSSEGGSNQGTTWYYGGNEVDNRYNNGYPYLRQFIKNWTTINFSPSEGGTVNPSSIKIPSNADQTLTTTSATIDKLNQTITASPDTSNGYYWSSWTKNSDTSYTANFERYSYTLTFNNATGVESGDIISPSGTSYTVYHGETISVSQTSGDGPLTLTYTFNNSEGVECVVSYTIPIKYDLITSNNPESITTDTTITPTVELKSFDINFGGTGGYWGSWTSVQASSASSGGVQYGTIIGYVVGETTVTITLTMNGQQKVFTANSGYEIEYLTITTEQQSTNYTPGSSGTIKVTGSIQFYAKALKLYEVTFVDAKSNKGETGIATLEANPKTIKIKQGYSVTGTYDETTRELEFKYNENVVAIYTGKEYYAILQETDKDKIEKVNDSSDLTIQPTFTFYACLVTMAKTDDSNCATMTVTGDTYDTTTDGIFAVEFGTTVKFSFNQSGGIFTYKYTFSSGQEITYTMKESKYAMQYELNPTTGDRESICNGLNNTDSYTFETPGSLEEINKYDEKEIKPNFGLRQTWGSLA